MKYESHSNYGGNFVCTVKFALFDQAGAHKHAQFELKALDFSGADAPHFDAAAAVAAPEVFRLIRFLPGASSRIDVPNRTGTGQTIKRNWPRPGGGKI